MKALGNIYNENKWKIDKFFIFQFSIKVLTLGVIQVYVSPYVGLINKHEFNRQVFRLSL